MYTRFLQNKHLISAFPTKENGCCTDAECAAASNWLNYLNMILLPDIAFSFNYCNDRAANSEHDHSNR